MGKKFWFKLDKDKIKLQLKDLGKKFSLRRKGSKKLTLLILLFMLIGVGIAIYNSDYDFPKKAEENPEVVIEPIVSREENITEEAQELTARPAEKESFPVEPARITNRQEREEKEPVEGVVTEPVRPVEKKTSQELKLLKPVSGDILQGPGWYYHPVFDDWRYQQGIELSGNPGDVVMAAASGNVISIKEDEYKGILVTIEHENGWQTEYGHLERTTVSPGDSVGKGQEIGRLGTTGISSQPSLYFDLKTSAGSIDPTKYFE